jgi:hypothetical protein
MLKCSRVGWLGLLRVIACLVAVMLVAGPAAAGGRGAMKTKTHNGRRDN